MSLLLAGLADGNEVKLADRCVEHLGGRLAMKLPMKRWPTLRTIMRKRRSLQNTDQ